MHRPAGAPTDDPASVSVDDECRGDEPRPRSRSRKSDTQSILGADAWNYRLIRSSGHGGRPAADGGADRLAADHAGELYRPHQAGNSERVTSNSSRRSCRQILHTADPEVLLERPAHLQPKRILTPGLADLRAGSILLATRA